MFCKDIKHNIKLGKTSQKHIDLENLMDTYIRFHFTISKSFSLIQQSMLVKTELEIFIHLNYEHTGTKRCHI